jgi:hypothetical protein
MLHGPNCWLAAFDFAAMAIHYPLDPFDQGLN